MSETNGARQDLPVADGNGGNRAATGNGGRTARTRVAPKTEDVGTDYPGAFPNSRKVYVEGTRGVRVPMREIHLTGGEPPLRVHDTSGPLGADVREGLPPLREAWIRARDVHETGRTRAPAPEVEMPETLARRTLRGGSGPITQMEWARKGEITPGDGVRRPPRGDGARVRARRRWPAAAPSSRRTSTTPSSSR